MIISETSGPFPAMLNVAMVTTGQQFLAEVIHMNNKTLHFECNEKWLVFRDSKIKAQLYPLIQDSEMLGIKQGDILSDIASAHDLALEIQSKGIAVSISDFAFSRDEKDPNTLNGQCVVVAIDGDGRSAEMMTVLDELLYVRFKHINRVKNIFSQT